MGSTTLGMSKTAALRYLNRRIAIVENGAETLVAEYGRNRFLTKRQARERFSDIRIQGDGKTHSAFKLWDTSPPHQYNPKRKYTGFRFAPGGVVEGPDTDFDPAHPRRYNLWLGWGVEPKEGRCDRFLDLMRNGLCAGDERLFEYLQNAVAHMFQYPGERCEVAIVIIGKQGTGKTLFAKTIAHLMNPAHVLHIINPALVTGRFTAHYGAKLLAVFNEAFWAGDLAAKGQVKALITDREITVEPKGRAPYQIENYCRFIFTSNESYAIHAEKDDRRHFVVKASDKHAKDARYFGPIVRELENGGHEALLYHFLYKVPLDGFDVNAAPKTAALMEQKLQSADPIEMFWVNETSEPELLEQCKRTGFVFKNDVYDAYCKMQHSSKHRVSTKIFWMKTQEIIGPVKTLGRKAKVKGGKTERIAELPKIEEARANLLKYLDISG